MSRRPGLSVIAALVPLVALVGLVGPPAESVAAPIARSVWLHGPDAAAVPAVQSRLDEVLDAVAEENRLRLVDRDVQVHIIPREMQLTDLPTWAHLRGQAVRSDPFPAARTYDGVRGLGPTSCDDGPLHIAIAEEQMLVVADGPYPSPRREELGKNLVHEIGHAVECSMSSTQQQALDKSFSAAQARYPSGIVGAYPAYTISQGREYFAEGTAAWFEAASTANYNRSWLAKNDPLLYRLLASIFAEPPPTSTCYGERATSVLTLDRTSFAGSAGRDIVVGSPADDVVSAGSGDDVICGGDGNDELYGGLGDDQIYGEAGDDSSNGGLGNDVVIDGAGTDRLTAGGGYDALDGRDGDPPSPDVLDGTESTARCLHDPDDELLGCQQ